MKRRQLSEFCFSKLNVISRVGLASYSIQTELGTVDYSILIIHLYGKKAWGNKSEFLAVEGDGFGVFPEILMGESEDANAAKAIVVDMPEVIGWFAPIAKPSVDTKTDISGGIDGEKGRAIAKPGPAIQDILLYFAPGPNS